MSDFEKPCYFYNVCKIPDNLITAITNDTCSFIAGGINATILQDLSNEIALFGVTWQPEQFCSLQTAHVLS